MTLDVSKLDFKKGKGSVTVVTQHALTGQVLVVALANEEALGRTLESGQMHYLSRARGLWHKGDTSGHVQEIVSLTADCDGDAVLARVLPSGPACHTGSPTCFGSLAADTLGELDALIDRRAASPPEGHPSYTSKLLSDPDLRLRRSPTRRESSCRRAPTATRGAPRKRRRTSSITSWWHCTP